MVIDCDRWLPMVIGGCLRAAFEGMQVPWHMQLREAGGEGGNRGFHPNLHRPAKGERQEVGKRQGEWAQRAHKRPPLHHCQKRGKPLSTQEFLDPRGSETPASRAANPEETFS